jgi:hypothetical protein
MQDLTYIKFPKIIISFVVQPKFAINLKTVPVDDEYHDGTQITTERNSVSFYPPTTDQLHYLKSLKYRKVVVMGE